MEIEDSEGGQSDDFDLDEQPSQPGLDHQGGSNDRSLDRSWTRPLVLTHLALSGFIEHIVKNHACRTLLVVCSTQQVFLQQLLASVNQGGVDLATAEPSHDADGERPDEAVNPASASASASPIPYLLSRSLNLLSASRHVRLAFCPSLPALHSYLTILPKPDDIAEAPALHRQSRSTPALALVNPLALHREASSFSAQGIGKTFAMAVEAAHRARQQLIMVECAVDEDLVLRDREHEEENLLSLDSTLPGLAQDVDMDARDDTELENSRRGQRQDPWEQELPILNSTTKTYGPASGKSWLGRTVKVADVAKRWCDIRKYSIWDFPPL